MTTTETPTDAPVDAEAQVGALLYGPLPTDDPALVQLADALDVLETAIANVSGGTRGDL